MSLRTDLIKLAYETPEHRGEILSLLKEAYGAVGPDGDWYEDDRYDDYDPSDDIPVEDCPDDELDSSEKSISKKADVFIKKMANEFKRQGWRIVYASADDYEVDDYRWLIYSSIEMRLKAGQTLQVGRKKITADRPLEAELSIHLYGYEGSQESGYTETQIDVDDFRQDPFVYTCPDNDLEEFDLDDLDGNGKVRRIKQKLYRIRDIEKFCEDFTKDFMLNSTRSKFKKKADMDLRDELIRLAYNKPELRSKILPLLKEAKAFSSQGQLDEYLKEHPNADPKNHTVEEGKSDAPGVEDKGLLGNLWAIVKELFSKLTGSKKELSAAEKEEREFKKSMLKKVGWDNVDPDDVEFVVFEGDFGAKNPANNNNFEPLEISKDERDKILGLQDNKKDLKAKVDKYQKDHDKAKKDAEEAEEEEETETKSKSKSTKPREWGDLPIGDRGHAKKKREQMTKAELVKAYQEAIKKSDMSPEDKKKAIEQSKKPNFDPEAALGAMGDDDEDDGGKTAMLLRDKLIRLAYDKPEFRSHLLPLLTKKAWGRRQEPDIAYVEQVSNAAGGTLSEPIRNLRIWTWYDDRQDRWKLAWVSNKQARRVKGYKKYNSEAERNKAYKTLIMNVKKRLDKKKEERAERAAERAAFQHTLKVGDILSGSWGYNQTNVTFAQVTKLVGSKMVEVRKITHKVVGDRGQELLVMPVKNSWANDSKVYKRRVGQGNSVKLNDIVWLGVWDGKPERKTHPMYGH